MNMKIYCEALTELNAAVNLCNEKTCGNNNKNIVQILLNKGAEVNLCTTTRVVPLFVACQYGHEQIAWIY